MRHDRAIRDWTRMHESLGYVADGKGGLKRDGELVERLIIKNFREKRIAEKRSDTGL